MKKVMFLFIATLSFSLSANSTESFSDCDDIAFDYADDIYEQTGDGFKAGRAFEVAHAICTAINNL